MSEETKSAQEYWKGFPESPVSSTFKWTDPEGYEHMTTMRAYSTAQLLQLIVRFKAELAEFGGVPKGEVKVSPAQSSIYEWLNNPDGTPAIEKGKTTLLVDGGGKSLDEKFKIACPLHSGKNLWLKQKDGGYWLSHKMDSGGYCNANIHERVKPLVE